ncbi:TMV resistance protein N-like [Abrus precatorius]|uniref:ADP-ribosyl cyclase/cyclic ADP-ribose hydrolase n=1 Tax=Abrus precatorius TaxID=3816 RepID=A0A8B8K0T9_ABRPR|nr:TMV resistance protein N-like [Abrus precatorius]
MESLTTLVANNTGVKYVPVIEEASSRPLTWKPKNKSGIFSLNDDAFGVRFAPYHTFSISRLASVDLKVIHRISQSMSFSSSSFSNPRWIYDVFINFRGEDTRNSFVSHLHASLANAGIQTFIDESLRKGKMLKVELMEAIKASHIAVVVFSKSYAESSYCLHELTEIMQCHASYGQVVVPIFYDVDPADVRHHKGAFGEPLEALAAKRYSQEVAEPMLSWWKKALTQAANLTGWDIKSYRSEAEQVKEIVKYIVTKLGNTLLSITDFPVGLESRVQEVIGFIGAQSITEFCKIGIWGMGGSGKTTTAKAIYNKIHRNFENRSFIENIREVWEKDNRGCINLQEQLISDLLKIDVKIWNIASGTTMIEKRLHQKKALIVFDDVTNFEQLKALCGNGKWIGSGTILIVTSRDIRLLNLLEVDHICKMKEMDENESLELFSWHAFRKASPREDFNELSRNVVLYCGGLPLALEVLGSYLYERTKQQWKCVLSKLEKIPNDQVQEKLKISYDGLNCEEKNIFLDICCFFIGKDRAYVTDVLDDCGFYPEMGITILVERSLIKVEKNNKLAMHDLLCDMGKEIVRQSSSQEPEKRSRLWAHEDVVDVLTEHTGTKAIEGLALKLERTSKVCFDTKAFEKMKRLRLLKLDHVHLVGDYEFLPKHLRWVYWQGFPLEHIPDNFYLGNVVAIDLKYSNIKLVWKEPQLLETLKIINLSHSRYLTKTPDFSKLPNLEQLILKDCPSLSDVHHSIGDLSNLLLINLKDCISLSNLPNRIYQSKSLQTLILSGCSKIDKLEENIVQMESLRTLIAKDAAIKEMPRSIVRSKSIGYISLCGYEGFTRDVFPSLLWSWMSPTMNPMSCIPSFGSMSCSSLVSMDISYLEKTSFTSTSQMLDHSLRSLLIGMGTYCQVFDELSKGMSKELTTSGSTGFSLPSDNFPHWLTYIGEGHSVLFKVPHSDWFMKGMILRVLYSSTAEIMADDCLSILIVNYTKCTIQLYKRDTSISFDDQDWQDIISNLGPKDNMEICVAFGQGLTIKRTTVFLIYDKSINVDPETSLNPKKKLRKDFI